MKDGRTHLAHKAEHAIDLDSGGIAGASRGRIKKLNESRSTRIDGASAATAAGRFSADAANCSSDRVHLYETGGLRRAQVRGHENVLKQLFVHAGAFNLGLWMQTLFGVGTPRSLQGRSVAHDAMITARRVIE